METKETIKLYIIQNKENKYFRAKGFSGHGDSWIDNIQSAKVYTKIGSAKRQVTYWAKNFPQYEIPVILELTATISNIMHQESRVKTVINNQNLQNNMRKLSELNRQFVEAKERYDKALKEAGRLCVGDC